MKAARLCSLLLAVGLCAQCGGRTGLGVWHDAGPEAGETDAAAGDASWDAAPSDAAPSDTLTPEDRGKRDDAPLGKNCAQIMLCVFGSLQGGVDFQKLLACAEGATLDGYSQAANVVVCLARNCGSLLLADGGGQFEILLCLMQKCHDELCACEGMKDIVPPGLLVCQ